MGKLHQVAFKFQYKEDACYYKHAHVCPHGHAMHEQVALTWHACATRHHAQPQLSTQ